jgi:hypothetical protein
MAILISLYLGDGFPLHKLDNAHDEFLANDVSG